MANILVIEDNVDVTMVLEKRLTDFGFDVLISNDANEGLKLARSAKPDLILLDLKLPDGGGLSILKNLKTSDSTREIPIVVLTGVRGSEIKESALKEGAAAYVEKPYEPQALLAVIKNALGGK